MKYSKTKSLEKVQHFPPEKQAPWFLSLGQSDLGASWLQAWTLHIPWKTDDREGDRSGF